MERPGIPHVPYGLTWIEDVPYSVCEDFITGATELVTAWRIIQTQKKPNEDRHLNNFGAIRNAETLEWIGMAPIYDSGSSLGYDKVTAEIRRGQNIICKPFKNHHEEQLKLVTDFSWIRFDRLSDVRERIMDVLSSGSAKDYMDESRIEAIADSVQQRILRVRKL